MIEVKNLYKRYHNHHNSDWVLKNINLHIPKNVNVGLIGANGAGKSTLLRLISGMDTPDRGKVIRRGRVSWPVGLSGSMQNNMTGRQNVKFVARTQGSSSTRIKQVIEFVRDFAEIGESFDEPVRTYSSGMRSRVSFGLSLAFNFDVYISDEATAVGDRAFKAKAQDLFKEKVGKASLIMVSHSEGILRELCTAGIYVKDGNAIWYDDIGDAIGEYHRDTDDRSILENLDNSSSNIDPKTLNKQQIETFRQELRKIRPKANGLHTLIRQANEEKWKKEELDVIRKAHQHAKEHVSGLADIINSTHDGVLRAAKGEVTRFEHGILGIEYGLQLAEQNKWPAEEYAVLEKAKALAYRKKSEKEAELEEIDENN